MRLRALLLLTSLLLAAPATQAAINPDWTTPLPPFQIADNLFYVGSRDLAAYLITTPAGNILLNANYTTSPPQIRHSVEQLGFHWRDTKILLVSHEHVDHAGGAAEIIRETGAKYEVMAGDASLAETGGRTDFAFGPRPQFPPAHVDRILHDGDQVTLGGVTLTAHLTAGHTRGCTTWTLQVHVPGEPATQRRNVVIVGSWSVLSEYRLVAHGHQPASYPGIAADYEHTFAELQSLPCDLFLGSHGSFFNLPAKLARMPREGDRVWIDPAGYQAAVARAKLAFETTLQRQTAAAAAAHP